MRTALALAFFLAATSCARGKSQAEPPDTEAEPAEPAAETPADAVVDAPASGGGATSEDQMLAFFDALGDLMVRDLLAWAAADFQTQAEARAEFDAVLDKTGEYSSVRMRAAAERVGIDPSAIVEFVDGNVTEYVRLAEASNFGPKVKRVLEGPEIAAQRQHVESLPPGRTGSASPEKVCKTMQALAVEAGEKASEEGIGECVEMMSEMQRVDAGAYGKMSACIMGSPTMAVAVDCIEKIEPSGR